MTNDEINLEIAEALGKVTRLSDAEYELAMKEWVAMKEWYEEEEHPHAALTRPVRVWVHTESDYCTDLNACHEMEKSLNEKEAVWYLQRLTQVRLREGVSGMIGCMIDKAVFATARQRAEAFLRVKGLWK